MKREIRFPEAIKSTGIVGGEFLFLSESVEKKGKKRYTLMKVKDTSIKEVPECKESVEGRKLPIYIKLINTFIFAGEMKLA